MSRSQIYVNRHKVNKIKRTGCEDEDCIHVRKGKDVRCGSRVEILDANGNAVARIIQDFAEPICSGATIWIETEYDPKVSGDYPNLNPHYPDAKEGLND